jgi:hypothetical protein
MEDPTPLTELAALYALDLLDQTERQQFEACLAESPELVEELSEWQTAVDAFPYSTPLVSFNADALKDRLFQRLEADRLELLEILPEQIPRDSDPEPAAQTPTIADLIEQAHQVSWQPSAVGVMMGTLYIDRRKREIAFFARAIPGVRFSNHRHGGHEEIVVLEGDFMVDGITYHPGDRIHSATDSVHQPQTPSGCLVFVRASLDNADIDE